MADNNTRHARIERKTNETDIVLDIAIDGSGRAAIDTGVPFMDHMLTLLAVHGFFDLSITASGDTHVDDHHTVEDIGICLGQGLRAALDGFAGIARYGDGAVPMDETLVRVCLDFSNRPYLACELPIRDRKVGTFDTALCEEFLRALAIHAGLTLHVDLVRGQNAHHIIEAVFKALGRALDRASAIDPRLRGALSSKGSL